MKLTKEDIIKTMEECGGFGASLESPEGVEYMAAVLLEKLEKDTPEPDCEPKERGK